MADKKTYEEQREHALKSIDAYYGVKLPDPTPEEEAKLEKSYQGFVKFMEQKQKDKRKTTEK